MIKFIYKTLFFWLYVVFTIYKIALEIPFLEKVFYRKNQADYYFSQMYLNDFKLVKTIVIITSVLWIIISILSLSKLLISTKIESNLKWTLFAINLLSMIMIIFIVIFNLWHPFPMIG